MVALYCGEPRPTPVRVQASVAPKQELLDNPDRRKDVLEALVDREYVIAQNVALRRQIERLEAELEAIKSSVVARALKAAVDTRSRPDTASARSRSTRRGCLVPRSGLQTGKTIDTTEPIGAQLWTAIQQRRAREILMVLQDVEPLPARYGPPTLVRPQKGQGVPRALVTNAH